MTLKKGFLICLVMLTVLIVAVPIVLKQLESMERQSTYQNLLKEGYSLVHDNGEGALDEAMSKGLEACRIEPLGKEALLLMGLIYYNKKDYNKSIEELSKVIRETDQIDYFPEINYHLGLSHAVLSRELLQRDEWQKALTCLMEASTGGYHCHDAYFRIAALYLLKYKETPSKEIKEKAALNIMRGRSLEEKMEGYVTNEPGSACPLCGTPFEKRSDDPAFKNIFQKLADN